MEQPPVPDRTGEWFVPSFGPNAFRVGIGMLFLPYTAMVLAFTVIGGMFAPAIDWTRVGGLLLIYLLALGIAAHALDAIGASGNKPWGSRFSKTHLIFIAVLALVAAYALGIYYMLSTPLLLPIALAEGFLLLAYNLEWFGGRFHTDSWFAFSWGALPVIAGYVLQTNSLTFASILAAGAAAAISVVEIKASRPYKHLVRHERRAPEDRLHIVQYEAILKAISSGTILIAFSLAGFRWSA